MAKKPPQPNMAKATAKARALQTAEFKKVTGFKGKLASEMTEKQKAAAIAREQKKAERNRAAFAKQQGAKNKMKAQGAKIGTTPSARLNQGRKGR